MKKLLLLLVLWCGVTQAQSPIQQFFSLNKAAVAYDADAQAYFDRLNTAGYAAPDATKVAVNNFITGLKSNDIYAAFKEFWLIIGGTATTHALGFKNAFNLTFAGSGITHSSTGLDFNGTGWANTGIVPSVQLTLNSTFFALYTRDVSLMTSTLADMGAQSGGANSTVLFIRRANATFSQSLYSVAVAVSAPGNKMVISNRTSSTNMQMWYNGTLVNTSTTAATGTRPTHAIYLGAYNNAGTTTGISTRDYNFFGVGVTGLTDAQATALSSLVTQLETDLSRQ